MNTLREYIREVMEAIPQIQPESQIFCDMDGVLVDFETAVVDLVNHVLDGGSLSGVPLSKGYHKRLRAVINQLGPDWRARSRPDLNIKVVKNFMMGAIGANPGPVFAEMSSHPDAIAELWPFLNSTGHRVILLSAPIRARNEETMSAGEGKKIWAEQLSPPPADIIIAPATQKVEYATTNGIPNILIDDKISTVDAWNVAGGIGILHIPKQSGATIRQLEELGL